MKVALALCADDEPARRLNANINEMERLVSELLELERLRQGRALQVERHDLMEIVRDAATTFADMAPGVLVENATQKVLLPLDADKIRSVLGNLLENARKFALPDSAPARVTVTESEESVEVRVIDDGPGIPHQDLANLFEPFYRVDRSRSKRTGGYGLGLSLCKRIMEAHGGSIEVTNNPKRGATFVMVFVKSALLS
jgi:signal transduction histidine kinase